jgi:hypothetical protein
MKWYALALFGVLAVLPARESAAQLQRLPIGNIAMVDDRSPTMWGMSGMEILRITRSIGSVTPIMRTETFDARTVEILSRTQAPPLRARDIRAVSQNGHDYVAVRNYLLLEVLPEDARAEKMSRGDLARKWAESIRRVLPQVSPMPNRFGV